MSRIGVPLVAAALGLAGAVAATLVLFHAAAAVLDQALEERLRAAGESAAVLLSAGGEPGRLQALMKTNSLDSVYLLEPDLRVAEDADGRPPHPPDLLRIDVDRVRQAFAGVTTVAPAYSMGELDVITGYFPVPSSDQRIRSVLALEAGKAFTASRVGLVRARAASLALSLLSALALAVLAARWTVAERARRRVAEQAARGESISKMAAMVAHEIRNPLGVIRGALELLRERTAGTQPEWHRSAVEDVLGEVERLHRLTEDFLHLGAPETPLAMTAVDLPAVLEEAARATETLFHGVQVRLEIGALPPVLGDPGRLRQVFSNLLANAAQAQGEGMIEVVAESHGGGGRVLVHDDGPGVPDTVREHLFDPFLTTKRGGTGLGLAIAKLLVDRHGGTIALLKVERGATFEVCLPFPSSQEARWPES